MWKIKTNSQEKDSYSIKKWIKTIHRKFKEVETRSQNAYKEMLKIIST